MAQTTITAFFNSRKRPASDDLISSKNKRIHTEQSTEKKSSRKTPLITAKDTEETCADKNIDSKQSDSAEPTLSQKPNAVFSKKSNANNVNKTADKTELVSLARKELSLGDIRKKLAGSTRLTELKASAERLSHGIQQLKQFKSIDVEVPSRSVFCTII